jgi:hypothetical protein
MIVMQTEHTDLRVQNKLTNTLNKTIYEMLS